MLQARRFTGRVGKKSPLEATGKEGLLVILPVLQQLEALTDCCCASLEHLDAAEAPFLAPRLLGEGLALRKSRARPKEDGHCPK